MTVQIRYITSFKADGDDKSFERLKLVKLQFPVSHKGETLFYFQIRLLLNNLLLQRDDSFRNLDLQKEPGSRVFRNTVTELNELKCLC